jgi:hypothetical protein
MFPLTEADSVRLKATQTVFIDEVLLKRLIVRDHVVAQRIGAEARSDTFIDVIVYMSPQLIVSSLRH